MPFLGVIDISAASIALLLILVIVYYKWSSTYWERHYIPTLPSGVHAGGIFDIAAQKVPVFMRVKLTYDKMKSLGHKNYGICVGLQPVYTAIDPSIIRDILTKDFAHFSDRGIYYNERHDPLSAHILSLEAEKWKYLRSKFTPTFTSGKMKMMFGNLLKCCENMQVAIEESSNKPINITGICSCFTIDCIGSCAFGIDCNTFTEKDAQLKEYANKPFQVSLFFILSSILCSTYKGIARKLKIKQNNPEVSDFFLNMIKTMIKYREENGIKRKDFLQLLIELRKEDSQGLSIEQIAAQSFLFFLAGFETSSTTMSLCIYELCQSIDIQENLRKEIEDVIDGHGGILTYDAVMQMKYLSQVIDETLRKYPPVPILPRECTKDYTTSEGGIIKKGIITFIPVYAIHTDPEYYPEPDKFDPERFSDESKSRRQAFTYLPFGEGPRMCLGERFGLLQVKIGLIALLRHYRLVLNSATTDPLQFHRLALLMQLGNPIWINAIKIK